MGLAFEKMVHYLRSCRVKTMLKSGFNPTGGSGNNAEGTGGMDCRGVGLRVRREESPVGRACYALCKLGKAPLSS